MEEEPRVGAVTVRPIGYVRTAHRSLADTPIQTSRNPDEAGVLVVLDAYAAGLDGLAEFDYAHLVCFLDRAWRADGDGSRPFDGDRLRPVPFLLKHTGQRVGVFATRAPVRPNYLALSLVRIVAVRGNEVHFTGVDLLDGTPVLDVKPFEPNLDVPGYRAGGGWLEGVRRGWYQQPDAASNPLVRPGEDGLRAVGLRAVGLHAVGLHDPAPAADASRDDRSAAVTPPSRTEEASTMELSARNQLSGTVQHIELGAVMAEVTVDVGGQRIVSAITRASAERLKLAEGRPVTVFIKATEVMLGVDGG
jgi:tRNA-Thr(GGU) m(6)t(6)A37 methyltransferase TsaA